MKRPDDLKIAVILIVVGFTGLFVLNFLSVPDSIPFSKYMTEPSGFQSNGEQIYFTASSNSSNPILASIGTMTMQGRRISCSICHGANGKGGSGRMMMWIFEAPDIRYSVLTSEDHGDHKNEKPYTDELIKRAITQGLDPEGKRLDPPMPVWQMSDEDLDELVEFLKTLE